MNWINRYIDEPLLHGAATVMKLWHGHTGQRPDLLEPVWNLLSIAFLLIAAIQCLAGEALWLSEAALVMLALPSVLKLYKASAASADYDLKDYKALRAAALQKRENEWALRLAVLVGALVLPLAKPVDDVTSAYFMLGACLWFSLTAPARFYLNAAEPPAPDEGDRLVRPALGSAA